MFSFGLAHLRVSGPNKKILAFERPCGGSLRQFVPHSEGSMHHGPIDANTGGWFERNPAFTNDGNVYLTSAAWLLPLDVLFPLRCFGLWLGVARVFGLFPRELRELSTVQLSTK